MDYIHDAILKQISKVQATERLLALTQQLCLARSGGGAKIAAALAQTQLKNHQAKLESLCVSITQLNDLVDEIENEEDDALVYDLKDKVDSIVKRPPKRFSVSQEFELSLSDLNQSMSQLQHIQTAADRIHQSSMERIEI